MECNHVDVQHFVVITQRLHTINYAKFICRNVNENRRTSERVRVTETEMVKPNENRMHAV